MKHLILIFLLITSFGLSAQKLDSLLNALEQNSNDSISIKANINLGRYYSKYSKYDSAFYYYQKAYVLADKLGETVDKILLLYTIGNTRYWTSYYQEADSLYRKGLELSYGIKDTALITKLHNSLGPNLLKLGDTLAAIDNLQKALLFCKNEKMKGNIYANLGQISRDKYDFHASLDYFQKSEDIWRKFNLQNHIARIQFEKGKIYFLQKKYLKSAHAISESIQKSSKTSNKAIQVWKYRRLAEAYEGLQQYDSAYYNFVIHSDMFRDVFSEKQIKNIQDLELKYETKLKDEVNLSLQTKTELQASVIEKQNFIFYLGLLLFLLTLVVIVVLWRNYRKNKKVNLLLNHQKKDLLSQKASLNESNEKLLKLDAYKQNLSAMLIHDLSNPLHVIKASTTNDNIIANADQMIIMVDNLLTIQKIEDDKLQIDLFDYQLSYLIDKAIKQNERFLKKHKIDLISNIRSDIFINADSFLLERVLQNLISNAVRFTQALGKITIDAQVLEQNKILIRVCDNGVGIEESDLKTIFEKYKQINNQNKHNYGLGLSFCKLAVESMGGEISVRSKKGQGSTFSFTLKGLQKPSFDIDQDVKKDFTYNKGLQLTLEEKESLSEYLLQLKQYKIYELSDINQLLKSIKKLEGQNIEEWLILIENAIYTSNNEQFQELINI